MAACIRYSGDNLDTEAIRPSQRKTPKRQQTGIKPMAVGTRHADFGPRAETNSYLMRARKMGKSLITASTQRIDFDLMVVLQRTTKPRVVAE